MRDSVGTLRWIRETVGILRRSDRLQLLGQGLLLQLSSAGPRLRRRLRST
jgi:hypothetical protein